MISIIGGCGRIGLPLGIVLANHFDVVLYDKDNEKIKLINKSIMPFEEQGADKLLKNVVKKKKLYATNNPKFIRNSETFIITIGTELDEFHNYNNNKFFNLFNFLKGKIISKNPNFIIRSTLFPNCCSQLINFLKLHYKEFYFSYCPERILQGESIKEINNLPQIISSMDIASYNNAKKLFSTICKKTIKLKFNEAEYTKLFCNGWRYSSFALSNQLLSSCLKNNINPKNVFKALKFSYPRTKGLPYPGFTAGPCLLKDTQTLASFDTDNLSMYSNSISVNESLPNFIINYYKKKFKINFNNKNILVVGLGFKKNSDDIRSSLTFKLIKILKNDNANIFAYDSKIKSIKKKDISFVNKNDVKSFNYVFMCNTDFEYTKLKFKKDVFIMSPWLDWLS